MLHQHPKMLSKPRAVVVWLLAFVLVAGLVPVIERPQAQAAEPKSAAQVEQAHESLAPSSEEPQATGDVPADASEVLPLEVAPMPLVDATPALLPGQSRAGGITEIPPDVQGYTFTAGETLTEANSPYYVTKNQTLWAPANRPGLTINGNVVLVIAKNVTLTVNGANGAEMSGPGYPGILLVEPNHLRVKGAGALNAIGGRGTSGQDGPNAGGNSYGNGGGAGGGAPGAGIGTLSGKGGTPGSGGGKGKDGGPGIAGGAVVDSSGQLIISEAAKVTAKSLGGSYSGEGSERSFGQALLPRDLILGGGGGGAGGTAAAIGTGGGGGGGGGGSGGSAGYGIEAVGGGGGGGGGYGGAGKGQRRADDYYYQWCSGVEGKGLTGGGGGSGAFASTWTKGGDGGAGGNRGPQLGYATDVYSTTSVTLSQGQTNPSVGDGHTARILRAYPIDECKFEFDQTDPLYNDALTYKYTGSEIKPRMKVTHIPTGHVVDPRGYNLTYNLNVLAGNAMITLQTTGSLVEGRDNLVDANYEQSASLEIKMFNIRYDMRDFEVAFKNTLPGTTNWYAADPLGAPVGEPYLKHKKGGADIPVNEYTIKPENNVAPGRETAKATISAFNTSKWSNYDPIFGLFSIMKPPVITTPNDVTFNDARLGVPYDRQFEATMEPAGADTINFSVAPGSTLPKGLYLSKTGRLTGTPEVGGAQVVKLRATNKAGFTEKEFRFEIPEVSGMMYYLKEGVRYPVSGGVVSAYLSSDTSQLLGRATTGANGQYVLTNVASYGEVDLVFEHPDILGYRVVKPERVSLDLSAGGAIVVDKEVERSVWITLDPGTGGTLAPGQEMVKGWPGDAVVASNAQPAAGYRFAGWFSASVGGDALPSVFPREDAVYFAHYDQRNYTVNYLTGEGEQVPARAANFDEANLLPNPEPKRWGYRIAKWYVSGDPTRVVTNADKYSDLVASADTSALDLVADWVKRDDIKVTLDSNGSTSYPASIDGAPTQVKAPLVYNDHLDYSPPLRDGFSFVGWSTDKVYADPSPNVPVMSLTVPGDHTTYYAQWLPKDIAVTFDAMAGTFADTGEDGVRTGKAGAGFDLAPLVPTRPGYTFTGWYATPTGPDLRFAADATDFTLPTESIYYYAQWKPAYVEVTLKAPGATPDLQTRKGNFATTVAYDLPNINGASFVGWKVEGADDATAVMFLSFPDKDTTYEAVFAVGKITLAFAPQGGTFELAGENGIRTGAYKDAYSAPADPVRAGYTFDGWYTTTEYATVAPTDGIFPIASATYYAKWIPAAATAVLNAPASDLEVQTPSGKVGEIINYTVPSRAGETFTGWKRAGEADDTATMFPRFTEVPGQVFEAVFAAGKVSVTYDAQGGTFATSSGTYLGTPGDTYTAPEDPTRAGYDFVAWMTQPNGGGTAVTSTTFPAQSNTTYYASWAPKHIKVTLEAPDSDNAATKSQAVEGNFNTEITYIPPTRADHVFLGWKTQGALDSAAQMRPKFPEGDTTLYAVWVKSSLTVTYEAEGGTFESGGSAMLGVPGMQYVSPAVKKAGHTFKGWFTSAIGGTLVHLGAAQAVMPQENVTYYAQWMPVQTSVEMLAVGSSLERQSFNGAFGTPIGYALPTLLGNAFVGWKVQGQQDSTATMFPTFPESATTYEAVWAAGKVNVSYDAQGGTFPQGENGIRTGAVGDSYPAVVAPTKSGYEFKGWFSTPDGAPGTEYTSTTFPAETSTVVYAKWASLRVSVTLDKNYAGAPAAEVVSDGVAGGAIVYTAPVRSGYAFVGWSSTQDNTPADNVMFPTFADADKTLYATWESNRVTATFDAAGGTHASGFAGFITGDANTTYDPTKVLWPVRTGFAFDGWYSAPVGGNSVSLGMLPAKSITYFAHWRALETSVELYDSTEPGATKIATHTGTYNTYVPAEAPVRAGYTFKGWTNDPALSTPQRYLRFAAGDSSYYALWEVQKIKDTYDPVSGTLAGGSTFEGAPGDTYTPPADPVRTGHQFLGWFSAPTGGTPATTTGTLGTQNNTYFAQWDIRSYTLTFNPQGGTIDGSGANKTLNAPFGSGAQVADPIRSGFVFAGWKAADASASDKPVFQVSVPAKDTTYNAQWQDAAEVNVVYDAQGGSVAGGVNIFTGKPGDTYTAPALDHKAGYTFGGWATSPSAAKDHEALESRTFAGAEHTTYYALWTADTYTVSLDYGQGAAVVNESGTIDQRINYTPPTREGSVFKGWALDPANDAPVLFPQFSDENNGKTLHALWTTQEINMYFNAMGGSGDTSVSGALGSTYTMPEPPVRAGFEFMGWFSLPGGAGVKFDHAAGTNVAFSLSDPSAVYAHWKAKTVTVILDQGLGDSNQKPTVFGQPGQRIPYTPPTAGDYTFAGWDTEGNYSPVFPTQDATMMAQWIARDVQVTFDSGEGIFLTDNTTQKIFTGPSDQSFPDPSIPPTESSIAPANWPAPVAPVRESFTFAGWYSDKTFTNKVSPFGLYPLTDLMLFAKWEPIVATVTLKAPGSTLPEQKKTGNAGTAILYDFPLRAGYTFKGWKVENAADSTASLHPTYPKVDTTYVGVFEAGTTTLHFDAMGGAFVAGETGQRTGDAGRPYTLPALDSVEREGYECTGWYTSPVGGSALAGPQIFPGVGATYYAQWKEEDIKVKLDPNGGTAGKTDYEGAFGTPIDYTIPAYTGHAFLGWSTTQDNASNDATMFPEYSKATQNKTLYAVWEAGKVGVAFFALEGAPSSHQVVSVNAKYTVPADPTRAGYRFAGWYSDPTSTTTKLPADANNEVDAGQIATTIAWYAHWAALDNIVLTLDPGFGQSVITTAAGKFGERVEFDSQGKDIDTPQESGYTFNGWKEHRVPAAPDSEARIGLLYPAANATYDAVWVPNNVQVTFDFNDKVTTSQTVAGTTGHTLTPPANPTRTGYTFSGWYSLAQGGVEITSTLFPALDAIYYARWEAHSLQAVMLAGDADDTALQRQEITGKQDSIIDYKIPKRNTYGFVGWQRTPSDPTNPNPIEFFPKHHEYSPGSSGTYEAQWQAGQFSALFVPEYSEFATASPAETGIRTGVAGEAYTNAPVLKAREGYRFDGWYFTPSAGGVDQKLIDFKIPAEDTIYRPKWEPLEISVTLDANQGSFEAHAPVLLKGKPGEAVDYALSMPKRAGFAFVGWSTTPDNASADAKMVPTFGTAPQTLFAQWAAGQSSVYFRAQGGQEISGNDLKLPHTGSPEEEYDIPQVKKQGYTFAGWYADAFDRGSASPGAAGGKGHLPGADITTYYAHWDADVLKVELDAGTGGVMVDPSPVKVGHQDEVIKYVAPTRPGYTFVGWTTAQPTTRAPGATSAQKYPTFDSTIAHEYKLYANWQINKIEVRFDAMGGTIDDGSDKKKTSVSVNNDSSNTYTLPQDPQRAGYTFDGWHLQVVTNSPHPAPNAQGTYDFPTQNTIYYAHWTRDRSEVVLKAPDSDQSQQTLTGTFGDAVAYIVPAIDNKIFDGWQKEGDDTAPVSRSVKFGETDASYVAVWSVASKVETIYYPQGGTLVGSQPAAGLPTTDFVAPGAARAGYTFKGWFTEPTPADLSAPDHLEGATVARTTDPVKGYFAGWEAKTLSVKLDENFTGGAVSAFLDGTVDGPVVYTMPKRVGYSFVGWSTTSDNSSNDKTEFPLYSEALDGKTLFAQWAPGKSSATFFANGGTGGTTRTGVVGDTYTVVDNPTRAGYAFDRWYSDEALSVDANLTAGQELTFGSEPNVSYWAGWIRTDTTLDLKLIDETSDIYASFSQPSLDPVGYVTPTRAGYTFMGWAATPAQTRGDLSLVQPSIDTVLYAAWAPNKINVSFEACGGTLEGTVSFVGTEGEPYVVPTMKERPGYDFVGWSLSPSGGAVVEPSGTMAPVSEIFFAQWSARDINVAMKLDGGQVAGAGGDLHYTGKFTDRIAFDTPTKDKHTFMGWRAEGSSAEPGLYLTYPDKNTTYVAVWQRDNLLRVSYFAEGGLVAGQSVFNDALTDTYIAPSATPASPGKVFAGWKTSPDTDIISHVAADVRGFGPEAHMSYYAHWAPLNNIKVTFDAQGGTMGGSTETYVMENLRVGDDIAYPAVVKTGAAFIGWVNADVPDDKPTQVLKVPLEDTTYTARWSTNTENSTRSVSYNPQGGEVVGSSIYIGRFGEPYTVPGVAKRAGYVFEGWAKAPEGRVEQKAGDLASFGVQVQTDYYGIWSLDASIAVTLDPNGGAMGSSSQAATISGLTYGKAVGYVAPTRTGYIFMGWSTDRTAQSGEVSLSAPAQNTTYYATWLDQNITPEMHSVFYDGMGGEVSRSVISGVRGGTYTAPVCAPRAGWVFTGWSAAPVGDISHGANAVRTFSDNVVEKYFAQWRPAADATVTLDAQGGTLTGQKVYNAQQPGASFAPSEPVREGYVFMGWSQDASALAGSGLIVVPEGASVFYALWTQRTDVNANLVIYDGAGGYATPRASFSGAAGTTYEAPSATGFANRSFIGWSTSPTGSVHHTALVPQVIPGVPKTTYFALWSEPVQVDLTLALDGGQINGSESDVVMAGQTPGSIIIPDMPVREGYVFAGWAHSGQESGSSAIVVPGQNTTYTALWTKLAEEKDTRVVQYFGMGGTVEPQSVMIGELGASYTAPGTAPRAGYSFEGWSETQDAVSVDHQAGQSVAFTEEPQKAYWAKWQRNQAHVTLDGQGGSPAVQTLGGDQGTPVMYATPARDGFVFAGWAQTPGSSVATSAPVFSPQLDGATLYAVWVERVAVVSDPKDGGIFPLETGPGYTGGSSFGPSGPSGMDADLSGTALGGNGNNAATKGALMLGMKLVGGDVSLAERADKRIYSFQAKEGYELETVVVDGLDVQLVDNTYTFDAYGDHTLAAVFKQKESTSLSDVFGTIVRDGSNILLLSIIPLIVGFIVAFVVRRTRRKYQQDKEQKEQQQKARA